MNITHIKHKLKTITVLQALLAVSIAGILSSCRHDTATVLPDDFGVKVVINSTDNAVKSPAGDNAYTSIAILAFAGEDLVGYYYYSGDSDMSNGNTTFPMTLRESGVIDFYVILNPQNNYYVIQNAAGEEVSIGETSGRWTQTEVRDWHLALAEPLPRDTELWYMPMTNLDGTSGGNRSFYISPNDYGRVIPIDVTRAASKVEVYFRSSNDQLPYAQPSINGNRYNEPRITRYYYQLDGLTLSMPVTGTDIFTGIVDENRDYITTPLATPFSVSHNVSYNWENSGFPGGGFPEYTGNQENFYTESYFIKVWTYYIFPNLFGGDNTGESTDNNTDKMTTLDISYSSHEVDAMYTFVDEWIWSNHWDFQGWEDPGTVESKGKTLYLPECERNTVIRVWCELNADDTDRSFTYTVLDWDETVTINVPDFN